MTAIKNTETGQWVKTLDPLTYTSVDGEALVLEDAAGVEAASALGDPHEPISPPPAPQPTNHPPR